MLIPHSIPALEQQIPHRKRFSRFRASIHRVTGVKVFFSPNMGVHGRFVLIPTPGKGEDLHLRHHMDESTN